VWLALLFAANPGLVIGSATDCPSADDVVAQLAPLLPAGMAAAAKDDVVHAEDPDRGDVSVEQGQRWVRLHRHNEAVDHERAIPASLSCAEAARAAAVLIAAWEFQGEAPIELPNAPAPSKAQPPPPTTTTTTTPATAPHPPPAQLATAGTSPATAPPAPSARRLGFGGGVAAAAHTDRLVTEVAAEVLLGPAAGIGWRLRAASTSRDSLPIGGGRAAWTRSSVGVGSALTRRRGRLGLQVHGDVLGAILSISGEDLAMSESGTQAAFGVAVGGRGLVSLGPGDLWLDLTVTSWPGRHEVLLRGTDQGSDLPAAELWAGVGVDFFVWP
jgi:hypothetical protein